LIADVSGFADRSCLTVTVSGMACATNPQPAGVMTPVNLDVYILAGNADDSDYQVTINAISAVQANWFAVAGPGNFKVDFVVDGQVNITEISVIQKNWFAIATCP
jgi:hypothetical protein